MSQARGIRLLGAVALAVLVTWAAPSAARADGNVNFFLGQKDLDKNDWSPVEEQSEFGAEVTFGKKGWPIQIAIDVLGSSDEDDSLGINVKGSTAELDFGVRKIWSAGKARPYVGGGLADVYSKFEVGGISDDDSSLGYWVGGGIFWRLGRAFNIGASLRYSKATVTMFGIDGEGGGTHFGLLLGWGWPAGR